MARSSPHKLLRKSRFRIDPQSQSPSTRSASRSVAQHTKPIFINTRYEALPLIDEHAIASRATPGFFFRKADRSLREARARLRKTRDRLGSGNPLARCARIVHCNNFVQSGPQQQRRSLCKNRYDKRQEMRLHSDVSSFRLCSVLRHEIPVPRAHLLRLADKSAAVARVPVHGIRRPCPNYEGSTTATKPNFCDSSDFFLLQQPTTIPTAYCTGCWTVLYTAPGQDPKPYPLNLKPQTPSLKP